MAKSYGAKVILCDSLAEANEKAQELGRSQRSLTIIPLGFDDPVFRGFLEQEIKAHWQYLSFSYDIQELWLPVGSGTLLKVFNKVVGHRVKIYGVNVNVLPESDHRISNIINDSKVKYIRCVEKFHQPSQNLPPIPSNLYYDAKLYSHLEKQASHGAFWWNVAK